MKSHATLFKRLVFALLAVVASFAPVMADSPLVFAFVHRNSAVVPDPTLMTHIIYYAADISEDCKQAVVLWPHRLLPLVALKQQNPNLKVMISVHATRFRFHDMAKSSSCRKAFAKDCKAMCKMYNLDGIDINWEFPTVGTNLNILNELPEDIDNFVELMKELRSQLGSDKIITFDAEHYGKFFDYERVMPYVDYVLDMCYDFDNPPRHMSPLYPTQLSRHSAKESLDVLLEKGVPQNKLVFGFPLYVRHATQYPKELDSFIKRREIPDGYREKWDEQGQVPYLVNSNDTLVASYENERSIVLKCNYAKQLGLPGVMTYEYSLDDPNHTLSRIVAREMLGR